jgi:hypothetical protein
MQMCSFLEQVEGYAYPCGKSSWCQRTFPRVFGPSLLGFACGLIVAELSSGEGNYRESASVLRFPNPFKFFRCVQFALYSPGVGIELKISSAYKIILLPLCYRNRPNHPDPLRGWFF